MVTCKLCAGYLVFRDKDSLISHYRSLRHQNKLELQKQKALNDKQHEQLVSEMKKNNNLLENMNAR